MLDTQNVMHCCRYCKYGVYVPVKRETLCEYSGITSSKSICKKYVFDPFKLKVRRARNMDFSKYSPEDFNIE